MLTKLQALELAKEWLERYAGDDVECPECPWCGSPSVHGKVADDLAAEIVLERAREKAARIKPPAGSNQPAGVGLASRCGGGT